MAKKRRQKLAPQRKGRHGAPGLHVETQRGGLSLLVETRAGVGLEPAPLPPGPRTGLGVRRPRPGLAPRVGSRDPGAARPAQVHARSVFKASETLCKSGDFLGKGTPPPSKPRKQASGTGGELSHSCVR